MTTTLNPSLPPRLTFRVGVTGARVLPEDADNVARIRADVGTVLEQIATAIRALATSPEATAGYQQAKPALRLVSPLAEGADRLVAEIGLATGFALEVLLPFAQPQYEHDFLERPGSVEVFRALLAKAGPRVLELDGGRGEQEAASYGAAGRLVVRNCDLLIALWDGRPGKGPGGTADTVHFAAHAGVPVWWVSLASPAVPPHLIEQPGQLRHPELATTGEAA